MNIKYLFLVHFVLFIMIGDVLYPADTSSSKAKIVLFRKGRTGILKMQIYFDDYRISKLSKKKYLVFDCDPGKHKIEAGGKPFIFEAEAGKEFYLKIGNPNKKQQISIMNASEAHETIKKFDEVSLPLAQILALPKTYKKKKHELLYTVLIIVFLYIVYYILTLFRYKYFPDVPDWALILYALAGMVALAVLSVIPLAYSRHWIPAEMMLPHVFFILAFGLLISFSLSIFSNDFILHFTAGFFIALLSTFYVSLASIAFIRHYHPEWLLSLNNMNFGDQTEIALLSAVTLTANIFLFVKLGKSRDLSGAYETSNSGYWATRDGKRYMSATKAQTGEWIPPASAFKRFFFINLFFGFIVFVVKMSSSLSAFRIFLVYLGVLLLASVFFAIKAFRLKK